MRLKFLVFVLSFLFSASLFSAMESEDCPTVNIEGVSPLVAGCVNVITGDYVESSNDLVVVGPEPLVFERFHSSSDFGANGLFSGWRHNFATWIHKSKEKHDSRSHKYVHLSYVENNGRITRYEQKIHHDSDRYYNPTLLQDFQGMTNCGSGVLSARTNPKNIIVEHDAKAREIDITSSSGSELNFHREHKYHTYNLITDTKLNGHTLKYSYEKDDIKEFKKVELTNSASGEVFSSFEIEDQTHGGSGKHYIKLFANDKRFVTYKLKKRKKTKSEEILGLPNSYLIERVERSDGWDEQYTHVERIGNPGYPGNYIASHNRPENRFRNIAYYKDKDKEVGITKKEDFRVNRVKKLEGPVGFNIKPELTHKFFYYETADKEGKLQCGHTDVLDALNHRKTYGYDGDRRLCHIDKQIGPTYQMYSRENFFWGANNGPDVCNLIGRLITDFLTNQPVKGTVYRYDNFGNVVHETLYGQITGKGPELAWNNDKPVENGVNCYSHVYSYNHKHLMQMDKEDNGKSVHYAYEGDSDRMVYKLIEEKLQVRIRNFYFYDENGVISKTVTDNGISSYEDNLAGITQRCIRYEEGREQFSINGQCAPIGVPEKVSEYYLDLSTNTERLLKRLQRTYSPEGYLTREEHYDQNDQLRFILTWQYDSFGNVIAETDALGQVTERKFNKYRQLTYERLPGRDFHVEHLYDFNGYLIESKEIYNMGMNLRTRYFYDRVGNRISMIDPYGHETKYKYDDLDRVVETTYPAIPVSNSDVPVTTKASQEYDVLDNVTMHSVENEQMTRTLYNIYGKPLKVTYQDGGFDTFEYSGDGALVETVARNGVITRYVNDAFGRPLSKEVHSSQGLICTTTFTYDGLHLLSSTDPEGAVTKYLYDFAGRLKEIDKHGSRSTYEYDELGRAYKTCEFYEANACRTTFRVYDLLDRVLEERVEEGDTGVVLRAVSFTYDAANNVTSRTEKTESGLSTVFTEYNGHNQPTKITDPLGNVTHITYNYAAKNSYKQIVLEVTTTDPLGNQSIVTMNAQGKTGMITKKDKMGDLTGCKELFYSGSGDLILTCEDVFPSEVERKITTYFAHDHMKRIREIVDAVGTPDEKHTYFEYNELGQKKSITKPDGRKIVYTYDALGRQETAQASDGSFYYQYEYDSNDHIIQIIDRNNNTKTIRKYDVKGNLVSEKLGNDLTLQYTYDLFGRPTSVTLPDSSSVAYEYNGSNLNTVKRLSKGKTVYSHEYHYDASGKVVGMQLPGFAGSESYQYNKAGQLVHMTAPSWTEHLSYDAMGNIVAQQANGESKTFTYDALYQITSENDHAYTYDSVNNRLSKDGQPCTVNNLNQLLKQGETCFTYDQNGNRLSETVGNKTILYGYDLLGRLTSVTNGDTRTLYTYDALDRRLCKQKQSQQNGTWKEVSKEVYLYQGQNDVGTMDALRILGIGKGAEIGATVAIELKGKLTVPVHDHNGNVVALLDQKGSLLESYRYTAFGEETITDGSGVKLDESAFGNPWRFSSKRVDSESGWVYFGRRYYDPGSARWTVQDPIGYEGGSNLYAYVMNNPLTHIDLYGLQAAQSEANWSVSAPWYHSFFQVAASCLSYIAQLPGRCIESAGYHMLPIPIVSDVIAMCGRFLAGDTDCWQPAYSSQHSKGVSPVGGDHQMAPNVAFLFCNGIMNCFSDGKAIAGAISSMLGGAYVGLLYNATHGLSFDISECILQAFGISTNSVDQAVKQIRKDLEKVGPSGVLEIFAHSQGGLVTWRALQKLTPDQRAQIEVYTFGSAKIIDAKSMGLRHAANYISMLDPVPFFADLIGCARGMSNGYGNLTFLSPGSYIPGMDHEFLNGPYERQADRVAKGLMDIYGR